jgi:periplasmic divalent cation tolerance protein
MKAIFSNDIRLVPCRAKRTIDNPDRKTTGRRAAKTMTDETAEAVVILTNLATVADATVLGDLLVGERLAASVNIIPGVVSIYRWEGRQVRAAEVTMAIKTVRAKADAVIAAIEREHPYACPPALVLAVEGGGHGYLEWIAGQTGKG